MVFHQDMKCLILLHLTDSQKRLQVVTELIPWGKELLFERTVVTVRWNLANEWDGQFGKVFASTHLIIDSLLHTNTAGNRLAGIKWFYGTAFYINFIVR